MGSAAQIHGRFEVLDTLSTNLLTTIHRGRLRGEQGFERPIALKRLRLSAAADLLRIDAFVEEAKIGASLKHPNLVETYALEAERDRPFIAMELVEGTSVATVLSRPRKEPLPAWWCVHVAMEVLAALDHMHHARPGPFVHGEVTPHNVLLGVGGEVKLADFGSAHTPRQVRRLAAPGHAAYQAPERLEGPADVSADVFSVGVLLWEMLAGRRLFDAASSSALARQIRAAPRPPPSHFHPEVSPALDAIVLTSLESEVEHRVANAFDLRQHLGAVLDALHGTVRRSELVDVVARLNARAPEEPPRARPPTPPPPAFACRPAEASETAYSVIRKRPSQAPLDDFVLLEGLLSGAASTRDRRLWVRDQHFTEVGPMSLADAFAHLSRMSETGRRSAGVSLDRARWARFDRVLHVLQGPYANCPPMNGACPAEALGATLARERPTGTVVAMRATLDGLETAILEVVEGVVGRDVGPQAWLAASSQVLQTALFDDTGLPDALEGALLDPDAAPWTNAAWSRFERARDLLLARRAERVLAWTVGSFGLSSGTRVDTVVPRV